jgi:hypothetical protein
MSAAENNFMNGIVYNGSPGTDMQSSTFPGICVLKSGRWLCSFRSAPAKRATSGQPAQPVDLCNGKIAMVYIDRTSIPEIRIAISKDRGSNWIPRKEALYRYESVCNQEDNKHSMNDAWSEMAKFSIGLPMVTITGNGDLLVVFYNGPTTDQTAIRWVRVLRDMLE